MISTTGSESAPAASCAGDCLVTREFSPLEPDTEEFKYYKPGVGQIVGVEDGTRTELVEFDTQPRRLLIRRRLSASGADAGAQRALDAAGRPPTLEGF